MIPDHATGRGPSSSNSPLQSSRSDKLKAALDYAARGIPVFPCKPDKSPHWVAGVLEHGHLDATTNPSRIHAWWNRWPDANIGIPTGTPSGIVSLDQDIYKARAWSTEDVKRELGPLPTTKVVGTGRGGLQRWYRRPPGELKNGIPEDVLGPGICIKADGGYVVAPPSFTEGPYKVLDDSPIGEAPAWLIQVLREPPRGEPPRGRSGRDKAGQPRSYAAGTDDPIPEGRRNWTLYRLACSMRARGASEAEILAGLQRANDERCRPPLEASELERITASAAKHAPGSATGSIATPEVLEILKWISAIVEAASWIGIGGKSERDVMIAMVKIARRHGKMIPAGVRVSVDYRTLALEAGMSRSSAHRAVQRLRRKGFLAYDNENRANNEAGAFVLRARKVGHSFHQVSPRVEEEGGLGVPPCAHPYTAPRLRWSAPRWDRIGGEYVRTTVRRMGKSCGQVVDILEYSGGSLDLYTLYACVYPYKDPADRRRWRPRDLRRRVISRLEAAGVVRVHNAHGTTTVSLQAGVWLDRLNAEREAAGEIEAHRRDARRYAVERDGYREHLAGGSPADPAPTRAEMDAARARRERIAAGAAGEIRELERVEDVGQRSCTDVPEVPPPADPALVEALVAFLARNPRRHDETPSWLSVALWADGYTPIKEPPAKIESALPLVSKPAA